LSVEEIPLSPSFSAVAALSTFALDEADQWDLALCAGDDYELCFTVPAQQRRRVEELCSQFACGCRAIGIIEQASGLRLQQSDGTLTILQNGGFDHFAQDPSPAGE